jgi:hypothetical protein
MKIQASVARMYRALAALLLAGCAAAPAASTPGVTSPEEMAASPSPEAAGGSPPGAQTESAAAQSGGPAATGEPPAGASSLPEVYVRNIGLHVGGGRNDAASKEPFLRALERQFPEFLRCYQLVEQPGQQGTFGVDLHVGRSGAVDRVEQPRPGLSGEDFRACMVRVFETVQFGSLAAPVVLSYSVRFSLRGQ